MNWLTIVTTLLAAILPSAISLITLHYNFKINKQNNEYQLKLKEKEFLYQQRNQALNSYADCLNTYLYYPSDKTKFDYLASILKVSLYVSPEVYYEIDSINKFINQNQLDTAREIEVDYLAKKLNEETHNNK